MKEESSYKVNSRHKKAHRQKTTEIIAGCLLITIAIILIIIFFLRGNTTIVNNKMETTKSTALACSSTIVKYPFFTHDNANSRELNIKLLFSNEDLRSVALDYSLFYNNETMATASEAHNHAAMNISYGTNGLGPDALNVKYTILDDRLRTNLFANASDIDIVSARYFLINTETAGGLPKTLTDYQQNYTRQGLDCKVIEQ